MELSHCHKRVHENILSSGCSAIGFGFLKLISFGQDSGTVFAQL